MLLIDGLYANGPVIEICRKNRCDYMIVLQDDSLKSVWDEYYGLLGLSPENEFNMQWGNRDQTFKWINNIDYEYQNEKKQLVHVVTCKETWKEVDKHTNEIICKKSNHAWISSRPFKDSGSAPTIALNIK